jgi:hypothetical protein
MVEVLRDFGVAAGAAIAGAGDAAHFFYGAQFERLNGVDKFAFGDMQTTADHAIGTVQAGIKSVHRQDPAGGDSDTETASQ